jgi:RNA polymerase sigma-70 factor (ECF subfamily)
MRDATTDFSAMMSRIESGEAGAERELIQRYGHHILRAIRRKLPSRLRSAYDSQDFCQAVWASFFTHRDEFARFKCDRDLMMFLGGIAFNKVVDEVRRRMVSQKRNVNRELSLEDAGPGFGQTLPSNTATPSQFAVAREEFERLTDGRPEKYKRIIELRAAGATFKEIARQVDMNERNVRKILQGVEQQVER